MNNSDIPTTTGLVKTQILNSLRKQHGDDKVLVQSFSDWKNSATSAINGTVDLVDKQDSIWSNHFSYVKSKQVFTLTGPIGLNDSTELTDTLIYANPQRNSLYGGARLVSSEDTAITNRSIDFNQENTYERRLAVRDTYGYIGYFIVLLKSAFLVFAVYLFIVKRKLLFLILALFGVFGISYMHLEHLIYILLQVKV